MAANDPLEGALERARAAKTAAEQEAARKEEEERQTKAREDAARERFRADLHEAGRSFVQHARKLRIRPEEVQINVGQRARYKGLVIRRQVGTTAIYERRSAWIVRASSHSGSQSYGDYRSYPGIYVLDDGTILGYLDDSTLPDGTAESVATELARYLADAGG